MSGPEFRHIQVGVGHRLDAFSSGVLGEVLQLGVKLNCKSKLWERFGLCSCHDVLQILVWYFK